MGIQLFVVKYYKMMPLEGQTRATMASWIEVRAGVRDLVREGRVAEAI